MICIQIGKKVVRSRKYREDSFRTITEKEHFDTPDKRESRIRAYEKKEKMRLSDG